MCLGIEYFGFICASTVTARGISSSVMIVWSNCGVYQLQTQAVRDFNDFCVYPWGFQGAQ